MRKATKLAAAACAFTLAYTGEAAAILSNMSGFIQPKGGKVVGPLVITSMQCAVDPASVQHERGGQTADAAADNDDLHCSTHKPTRNPRRIMVRKVHPVQRFSRDVVDGALAAAVGAYLSAVAI